MKVEKILNVAVRGGASDLIVKQDAVPRVRYNQELVTLANAPVVSAELMQEWIGEIVPVHMRANMSRLEDLDFAYQSESGQRFRVNLFRQRGAYAFVMRLIHAHVRTLEELQLPPIVEQLTMERRGLILVTGATGSGKTTTLAAMIEKINATRPAHIITIEDPIEFLFTEKKSTINQREIGIDTTSFSGALRSALRQNPDVILVGELRDQATIETALMAAETGHLVMSTLHTLDAVETIPRILSHFPPHQHDSIRIMLSQVVKAVLSQRLLPRADKKGMVAAMEIMVNNELIKEQILTATDFKILKDAISKGQESYGMQTFDQALFGLYSRQAITREEALGQCTNKGNFELALRGISK